jgi:DNA-binding response OmpR family regulator
VSFGAPRPYLHDDSTLEVIELSDTILVVEDDDATRDFLADHLTADSYGVMTASSGRQALNLLEVKRCDLVLLDVMLPDASGFELCRRLRAADGIAQRIDPQTPVIMLSGRASETDRVRGFARGADDYVAKPFNYPELAARIAAVLRRARARGERGLVQVGELRVDPASREVRLGERLVDLSAKEFALLHTLASDPTRVFTKEELLRDVWGFKLMGSTRTLDSHASRLRRKLAPAGSGRRWIVNVWGVGYRLTDRTD